MISAGRVFPRSVPIVTQIPDHGQPHAGWITKRLTAPDSKDILLVSNPETFDWAVKNGVPKDRVRVSGYPVRQAFEDIRAESRAELRRDFGIPPDAKVMPIASGGGRWSPDVSGYAKELATTKDLRADGMHLVVITGGNKEIVRAVRKIEAETREARASMPNGGLRIHIRSNRSSDNEMAYFSRMASAAIIKAGGGAIGETYATRTTAFLFDELSGIEPPNRKRVVKQGTGIDVRDKARWLEAVLAFDEARDAEQYLVEQDKQEVPGSAQWISDFLHAKATDGPEPKERFEEAMAPRRAELLASARGLPALSKTLLQPLKQLVGRATRIAVQD